MKGYDRLYFFCQLWCFFPFSGHAIARFGVIQVKISPLIHNIFILRNVCQRNNKMPSRVTRPLPLVEQELLTISEHMSSHPVLVGVRVAQI
jgi:hypothetical protein